MARKKRCISAYNVWNIWDGILSIELLCGGGDIKCRNRNSSAVYGADHYYAVRFCSHKKVPQRIEMLALVLAVGGTFLLATHGNITNLAISTETLVWGLASAVAMALYNLIPGELMKKFGTFNVIGWGMLIGGIFLCVFIKPWHVIGMWDIYTVLAMAAVILVGTILSFTTYMEGVRLIGASKASLFASVEPVTATFMTVVFMGAAFQFVDFIGLAGILGAVLMLSLLKKE